jgi:hypothetical protein
MELNKAQRMLLGIAIGDAFGRAFENKRTIRRFKIYRTQDNTIMKIVKTIAPLLKGIMVPIIIYKTFSYYYIILFR